MYEAEEALHYTVCVLDYILFTLCAALLIIVSVDERESVHKSECSRDLMGLYTFPELALKRLTYDASQAVVEK